MTTIHPIYIAASANRHPHAADVSSLSCVAYGSSNLISLWQLSPDSDIGVTETLPGHEGRVTCVRFASADAFVSTDDKGTIAYWKYAGGKWTLLKKIQGHQNAISSLCVEGGRVVTGGSDAFVKVWQAVCSEKSAEIREVQGLSLQGKYPLALALCHLPNSDATILAIAGTDRNVQLWVCSEDNIFRKAAVLSGHEDWVRSLAFKASDSPADPLVLASGSQDSTIRLWNIEPWKKETEGSNPHPEGVLSDDLLDAFEASLGEIADEEGGRQISLKRHILTVRSDPGRSSQYSVTFDALLIGHEAGITSLHWRPGRAEDVSTLLSTSTDSSVILWTQSTPIPSSAGASSSVWINHQRFGDIGGQRLGGFVGGLWGREGAEVLAWGWAGGWRRWVFDNGWGERGAVSGHNGPVKHVDWSPGGEYLISASLDQTTRIHAPIVDGTERSWHELARPQVHGYDVLGVGFLDALKFASIADEKVVRVFEAPRAFIDLADALGVVKFSDVKGDRPMTANVPPLGLSNKAIVQDNTQTSTVAVQQVRRQFEGELASVTLWPEVEKVFGHGYESITLAVSNSRKFIATACKATTPEHAVVRIYNTETFQLFGQPLGGHTLTVTRIAFSPDDRFILSVSRDRSWRLYERLETGEYKFSRSDKSHARIIWDCAWTKEGDAFATASRDKTVKAWSHIDDKVWVAVATIKVNAAATALDISPAVGGRRRLVVGLETGVVLLYSAPLGSVDKWDLDATLDNRFAHVNHIHRLAWRPTSDKESLELASCSEDGTLKILTIQSTSSKKNHPK